MTDVVVLEKESLVGTGSTGRCAGGFRHQFSTEANIRLSLLSIEKLIDFQQEMDQPLDTHQDGYLFLLNDEKQVAVFEESGALQQKLGIPTQILSPEEIPQVLPGTELNLDGILAASYCSKDGVSDPAGVTEGYRRHARRLGLAVETDREVTGNRLILLGGCDRHDGHCGVDRIGDARGPLCRARLIGRIVGSGLNQVVPVVVLLRIKLESVRLRIVDVHQIVAHVELDACDFLVIRGRGADHNDVRDRPGNVERHLRGNRVVSRCRLEGERITRDCVASRVR